ncbi:ATP-binding protein [Leptospira montravelensis]|uniref:ATP-binding protein n=1 Tax=Leptospira montravelensis TaxID=2484961 RepID=A0ABY2LS02_9LEPT|nr:AAA family ATPase [Leptospira montravelensis]TGK78190.1 ATP-binding protein [Leptospira montravelensis]TGL03764.1 ATP-binding protein [Leptospira montravelensis]
MRLKTVYISKYKNLKDFTMNFEGDSFLDIFVGKNGSGKSNLFEALIEIFRHLYEFDSRNIQIDFDYLIHYEIESAPIVISWTDNKLRINEVVRKSIGRTPIPDNLLIYYSGHNAKVSDLVLHYEELFKKRIKKASTDESSKFKGINKGYKNLLLSLIMIQAEENKARKFIIRQLGIRNISSELKLKLRRPFYANKKTIIDPGDSETHYWGAKGITKSFLDRLLTCKAEGSTHKDGYQEKEDIYIFYLDIKKIRKEFKSDSSQQLFREFDNLKTIEMLENISVDIHLSDGTQADVEHFSDGQFQSVYIYSILELFKDRNCIMLLDEPDSFLHPEWQFEFLGKLLEISEHPVKNNHVLMSSHSASTIAFSGIDYINSLSIEQSKVVSNKVPIKEVIKSLSAGLIKYSEDERILRIDRALRMTDKSVLFVEGPTDVLILETAYQKLYNEEDMPFLIQDAFDRGFIKILLLRSEIYANYQNKTFFGLFDFDEAYNDWRELPGDLVEEEICNGLCKKLRNREAFAFLLPLPQNELKNQVWNDNNPVDKVKANPCFSIEHLFWGLTETNCYFKENNRNLEKEFIFKGDKIHFAKEIVPNLPGEAFKPLRPMFDFIRGKL